MRSDYELNRRGWYADHVNHIWRDGSLTADVKRAITDDTERVVLRKKNGTKPSFIDVNRAIKTFWDEEERNKIDIDGDKASITLTRVIVTPAPITYAQWGKLKSDWMDRFEEVLYDAFLGDEKSAWSAELIEDFLGYIGVDYEEIRKVKAEIKKQAAERQAVIDAENGV